MITGLTSLTRRKRSRAQIFTWRPDALTCMINSHFPCIKGFFKAWLNLKTSFHFRPSKTHNNLLHSPIFFYPWILRNPTVKKFEDYGNPVEEKNVLKPESFSLSNNDCRHRKLIDMLDKQGFKPLSVLKDDPGSSNLNWFIHILQTLNYTGKIQ